MSFWKVFFPDFSGVNIKSFQPVQRRISSSFTIQDNRSNSDEQDLSCSLGDKNVLLCSRMMAFLPLGTTGR